MDLDELLLGEGVVELARAVGIISGWGLGYFMCEFFFLGILGVVGGLRPVSGERRKGVGMVLRIEFLSGIQSKLLSILSIYMGLFHRSIIVLFLWDISYGIVALFLSPLSVRELGVCMNS